MSNTPTPTLSIQGLSKSFKMNNDSKLEVLKDICLDIKQNEMVGLIGHSGCGKTTLLRIVCAFESLDEGNVFVDGVKHTSPGKDVLMLFQDVNQLLPWRTVVGNIVRPLLDTKTITNKTEAKARAQKLIDDVGLSGFENVYPHQLSGGMKQRAAVARALALRPRILLMDEPFASLDNITRSTLQILTRNICEKHGITVLFVTHSVDEAVIMADMIVVMDKNPGRIKKIIENPYRSVYTPQQRALFVADVMELLGNV